MAKRLMIIGMLLLASGQTVWTQRGIQLKGGPADSAEIKVLKYNGQHWVLAGAAESFVKCDLVRVQARSTLDGFAYLLNREPSGRLVALAVTPMVKGRDLEFPGGRHDGKFSEKFRAQCGARYGFAGAPGQAARALPAEDFLWFDDEQGAEVLKLVFSPRRISRLDEALQKNDRLVAEADTPSLIEPEKPPADACRSLNLRCRSLGFEPSDPHKQKGAVVAVPDGRLKENEVMVVAITLRHGR